MKNTILILLLTYLFAVSINAQTHNSIPMEEESLYRLLEIAEISGMIDPLPAARPLPRSRIKRALQQLGDFRDEFSAGQKSVLDDYVDRFGKDKEEPFLKDGDLRIEHDVFPLNWQFYAEHQSNVDVNDTSQFGIQNSVKGIFSGDMGKYLSYGFDLQFQLNRIHIDDNAPYPYAWAPYTYSKNWDGSVRHLSDPSPQYLMPGKLSMGWAMHTELVLSAWENRVGFRFGRMRRDWGLGEGNLFLDKQARPFMGLEGTVSPWKWLSMTFLFGSLESAPSFRNSPFVSNKYPSVEGGDNYTVGPREVSKVQQNMLSLFQLEIRPARWLYISLYDGIVYLRRFELGYMFPFMSRLLTQGNVGDFDNVVFGGTIALSWPGIFRTYGTVLVDEWKPGFQLSDLRNQMAVQAGIKVAVPMGIWSLFTFQYTKIEPFTYTHYATGGTPWYYSDPDDPTLEMETGYQNHGENLGSYLEPNSDEFLIAFHIQPSPAWTAGFSYRLIRHGGSDVNGSTYDAWGYDAVGGPDGDPNGAYYPSGTKNFLKDGTYEWFHIFSLGGSVDLRGLFAPVQLSLQYNFVYEYDSHYGNKNNFTAVAGSEMFRHLLTINVKLWPK